MFYPVSKSFWLVVEPGNFLLVVALLGLALSYTSRRRLGRAVTATALLAIMALAVLPIGESMLSVLEQRFPSWQDDGRDIDGIVVLGGAVNPDLYKERSGSGMNGAIGRITAAAALAHRFKGARIVFAGGRAATPGSGLAEAQIAAEIFATLGIDKTRLSLDADSRSTSENAVFAKRIATPKPGERWVLVTSAFHMPRAIGCFRAVDFPVSAYPVDYRTPPPGTPFENSLGVVSGLTFASIALHEFIGLGAYRMTGRTQAWFPAP